MPSQQRRNTKFLVDYNKKLKAIKCRQREHARLYLHRKVSARHNPAKPPEPQTNVTSRDSIESANLENDSSVSPLPSPIPAGSAGNPD